MNNVRKILAGVVGILLGLLFVLSGLMVLFKLAPMPPIPEGTAQAQFMAAFGPTGYLNFVKILEVVGGVLVAIPRTRNLGLLVLGPIILNILAYHAFVMNGEGLFAAPMFIIVLPALFLLWVERKAFGGLVARVRA